MGNTAVSIGTFDGAHVGHAALIRRARSLVGEGGRVVALAFDPHPVSVLRPGAEPATLTTIDQRAERLRAMGADEVLRLEPDRELLGFSPRRFMMHVRDSLGPCALVEGSDFHFGRGRAGDISVLSGIARDLGFELTVVPDVDVVLCDQTIRKASSTLVRRLVGLGRVRDAAAVLGRPYELTGTVLRGDRRGRTIGFPTANTIPEQTPPADGVYAAWAVLPGGEGHETRRTPAAVNVGARPTVSGTERRVEAHLLGLDTSWHADRPLSPGGESGQGTGWRTLDGLPEYGWPIRLEILSRVRDEVRFGGLGELTEQIARDCGRVLERCESGFAVAAGLPHP